MEAYAATFIWFGAPGSSSATFVPKAIESYYTNTVWHVRAGAFVCLFVCFVDVSIHVFNYTHVYINYSLPYTYMYIYSFHIIYIYIYMSALINK